MIRITTNRVGSKKFFFYLWSVMCAIVVFLIYWWFILPIPVFKTPYSTVLLDRDENILGMTIADDGQFRMPVVQSLPEKYITALLTFEDKRFFYHRGVDPLALLRAIGLNIKNGTVVSGGSTLTMQTVRLSQGNPPRTVPEKIKEMFLALRIEQRFSKDEILNRYIHHAPFGGNIVGLPAASMKYFNRPPDELSWAEAALLAVLPNSPALIFPGKNIVALKNKRDLLLQRLRDAGYLSGEDLELAVSEPLPNRIFQLECATPHLLANAFLQRKGVVSETYIDGKLQRQINTIVKRHAEILSHNHICNAAVLVAHIPSGEVRAYVGNSPVIREENGNHVDIITARRSSGSILKPALYALMQASGDILPQTIVSDIPSRFGSYVPENFSKDFKGVVPADKALSASLNVPFVRMLQNYGIGHFYDNLKRMGITTLDRSAGNYGLSLILGGAECSLWDLCNLYGGFVSILRHYNECDGVQYDNEFSRLRLWKDEMRDSSVNHYPVIDAASVWFTLKALQDVERPDMESGWKNFASSVDLCWKTGTSFGFRDAWAVGVNPEYVVGVWVGNANGEGRPGLVGVRVAAPILFEVAALLRTDLELYAPREEMIRTVVCRQSGHRASAICPEVDTVWTTSAAEKNRPCPYHRLLHLDSTGRYRVNSECEPVSRIQVKPWFVLSPVQEWYYVQSHADYKKMPPYRSDCRKEREGVMEMMEMIYPQRGLRVFIPKDWEGESKGVIFEMAHREPSTTVYWHIDNHYMGATRYHHQIEINVTPGRHLIHLVDASGNTLNQSFYVSRGDENHIDPSTGK